MSVPLATYRIQLRGGMDFEGVADLGPYLAKLGISHCYLSPITAAMPGSAHGYDVTDFTTIEPDLGGHEGFVSMAGALRSHGIKILLDIVPNHMAASPMNGWWHDVLEWGQASPRAIFFDIDWSAPKLLVPVLGVHYAEALADGAIRLSADRVTGTLSLRYGDLDLPLTPSSYSYVLGFASGPLFAELSLRFAASSPGGAAELKSALAELLVTDGGELDAAVSAINADKSALHHLHEQQIWRLAHWRLARESLTYRRFFEISDLVGVRVEEPTVFDDVHRCVIDLVRQGLVDGLRIDHIDGLADPFGYLRRLRSAVGDETYIVVEKILGPDEELRQSWPVAGTTGYEFIGDMARLFVPPSLEPLSKAYTAATGESGDLDAAIAIAKRRTFNRNLAGELDHLTQLASRLSQADIATRDFGTDTLRRSIVEMASAFPVYRTYVDAAGPAPEDQQLIARAMARARASGEVEDETAFDFLADLMSLTGTTPERQAAALGFTTRFQQTTGPLMAKSLEDTVFYRFNRLIALNEVGGEAGLAGGSLEATHAAMERRRASAANALSATATHDTKRGEDARARIYAIAEDAEGWAAAVGRWMDMNARLRSGNSGAVIPEANTEWMYYQSLLGAWPPTLSATDQAGLSALAERMTAFMIKATREAKRHTSWTKPDDAYEAALTAFVRDSLDPQRSANFLTDFLAVARPLFAAGCVTSLVQAVIKVLAPGVPDVFQGTELWDLSLVDPDNRRAVDYAARRALLEAEAQDPVALLERWEDGAVKLAVLRAALAVRIGFGTDFVEAAYVPLRVEGPRAENVFAFARIAEQRSCVVIGVRLASGLLAGAERPTLAESVWQGTRLICPAGQNMQRFENAFCREGVAVTDGKIDLAQAMGRFPVAVLTN